jgi:hypothetical protein
MGRPCDWWRWAGVEVGGGCLMTKRKNSAPPATTATSATQGANEWGLPNWTDAGDYGDWENWKFSRWRWEFNRRKSNYRSQALEFFEILKTRDALTSELRANETPEARNRFNKLVDLQAQSFTAFWRQWGYIEILDPRVSFYSDEKLKTLHHDGFRMMDGSASSEAGRSSITPHIGQTAIIFDLEKPLPEQLRIASVALKKKQVALFGKPIQRRKQILKWIGYLQTLDAFETKAPWTEIASLHTGTAQTDQTVRDIRDQATALCFNF